MSCFQALETNEWVMEKRLFVNIEMFSSWFIWQVLTIFYSVILFCEQKPLFYYTFSFLNFLSLWCYFLTFLVSVLCKLFQTTCRLTNVNSCLFMSLCNHRSCHIYESLHVTSHFYCTYIMFFCFLCKCCFSSLFCCILDFYCTFSFSHYTEKYVGISSLLPKTLSTT